MRATLLLAGVALALAAMLAVDRRGGRAGRAARRVLRVAPLVAAVCAGAVALPLLRQDGTPAAFNAVALGIPLAAAVVGALPGRGLAAVVATWVAAAVLVAYVLVFGLGIGWYFAPAAVLLLAAAAARGAGRTSRPEAGGGATEVG